MHFRFYFVTRRYKAADSCVILRRPATDEDALLGIVPIIRRIVETIIPDDEERSRLYGKSAHIRKSRCKSVLCMPIRSKGEFKGILYLGNNLAVGVINQRREEHLAPIAAQLTISLENVYLYEHLRFLVVERSTALHEEIKVRREAEEKLAYPANYDALTGFPTAGCSSKCSRVRCTRPKRAARRSRRSTWIRTVQRGERHLQAREGRCSARKVGETAATIRT